MQKKTTTLHNLKDRQRLLSRAWEGFTYADRYALICEIRLTLKVEVRKIKVPLPSPCLEAIGKSRLLTASLSPLALACIRPRVGDSAFNVGKFNNHFFL